MNPVLVVEDDEGDALLVTECLSEAGYPADAVLWRRTLADGIAALVHQPSCVLLDLGLPDAEGLAAVRLCAEHAVDVPIIVLTGRNDRTGVDAVAAGAQDYLIKDDITPGLLDRSIRYAIERTRAQAAEVRLQAQELMSAENARLERGLLPTPLLRSERFSCRTHYQPGSGFAVLGGDFYDVIETADGRIRAVIGDVMGHGPDEAALGVHLRVAWRTLVLAGVDDALILPIMARLLAAENRDQVGFVTVCDLTIDHLLGVTLRVAGHPAPLISVDGVTSLLAVEVGPPLGIERLHTSAVRGGIPWDDMTGWPATRALLQPGASLLLYTDGLLERYRIRDDRASLGTDELLAAANAAAAAGRAVSEWIPVIVGSAPETSLDDTAVIVLTVQESPELAAVSSVDAAGR